MEKNVESFYSSGVDGFEYRSLQNQNLGNKSKSGVVARFLGQASYWGDFIRLWGC